MVFPELSDNPAIVFRHEGTILFVRHLTFGHPESVFHTGFKCRPAIGFTIVTSHHKLSGRYPHKIHRYSRSYFDLTGFLSVGLLFFCCLIFIERPTGNFHVPGFGFLHRSRHDRLDGPFTFQYFRIIGQFFPPIHPCLIVFVRQFDPTVVLVKFIHFGNVDKLSIIRSIEIDPVVKCFPFLIRQFHPIMSFFEHTHQLGIGSMIFVRFQYIHFSLGSLTVYIRHDGQVALAPGTSETRIIRIHTSAGQVHMTLFIVTSHTSPIEDRLNFQVEGKRTNASFRSLQAMGFRLGSDRTLRNRDLVLIFMATDTRYGFSRHRSKPASHPLYGPSLSIQRLNSDRRIGRYFEYSRSILFDRYGSQQPFDIPSRLNSLGIMIGSCHPISIFISQNP